MDISLTKLPWWAQIGAFVRPGDRGRAAPSAGTIEMPGARRHGRAPDAIDGAEGRHHQGPGHREEAAGIPQRRSPSSKRVSASLKAVLPEEKDAADLLNRMQTVAAQSNLTIKSFKPGATVTKQLHAEWPITLELDGTYHNLAIFFDRVGKFTRIVNISGLNVKGKDKPEPESTITASCVATTFVLLDKPAPASLAPSQARRRAGHKGA